MCGVVQLCDAMLQAIPLHNEQPQLYSWEHPTDTSDAYITFYVFDLTNPNEVLNGATPVLVQKGPYTYR